MKFVTGRLLPGLFLVVIAFWSGSHANPTIGLIGFLPFFSLGVVIILKGVEELRRGPGREPRDGKGAGDPGER